MQLLQMSHLQRSWRGRTFSLISKQISLSRGVMNWRLAAGTCLYDQASAAVVPNRLRLSEVFQVVQGRTLAEV
ncbi:hypothetical protein BJX76DRAFT_334262 [Aspergillus varians]